MVNYMSRFFNVFLQYRHVQMGDWCKNNKYENINNWGGEACAAGMCRYI